MSENKLTGSLMPSLASFRKLETLNLASNCFDGDVTALNREDTWDYLTMTDISDNNFSGEFSACALTAEMKDSSGAPTTSRVVATDNTDLTCLSMCWEDVIHETGQDPASSIILEIDSSLALCEHNPVDRSYVRPRTILH